MNRTTLERTSDRELLVTRTFNAAAHIVFEAFTKPEFVRRWWAPKSWHAEIVSCDADVQVDGRYRYVFRQEKRGEMAFSGIYREVTPPARLVYLEQFEPTAQGAEVCPIGSIVTVTFDDDSGRTRFTSRSHFPAKAVLDMVLGAGMEIVKRETMDQLDALVASL